MMMSELHPYQQFSFPWTKRVLKNGLTVIAHQDTEATDMSLSIVYRVGSKDEPAGKSGTAHLFEHLMFTGSKAFPGNYTHHMKEAGVTNVNAYTSQDLTCYYSSFRPELLDYVLYAEADRMETLGETLTAEGLKQQQAVVVEEKAQRENEPFGLLTEAMNQAMFPVGHPYYHAIIGSVVDIEGMTLEAAREWHQRFYAANNAFIVIGGPQEAEHLIDRIEYYFSHVPSFSGGQITDLTRLPLPEKHSEARRQLVAPVPGNGAIYLVWPSAANRDPECIYLEMGTVILGGSTFAPLQSLIEEGGDILHIQVQQTAGAICSNFSVSIELAEGADRRQVEKRVLQKLHALTQVAFTTEAIENTKPGIRHSIEEKIDSLSGRLNTLMEGEFYQNKPDFYLDEISVAMKATSECLQSAFTRLLASPPVVIDVVPQKSWEITAKKTNQKPEILPPSIWGENLTPKTHSSMLPGEIHLVSAVRKSARDAVLRLELPTGSLMESSNYKGLTSLLSRMPEHGLNNFTPEELHRFCEREGIRINCGGTGAGFVVEVTSPASSAIKAAELMKSIILKPRFDDDVIEKHKREQLHHLRTEKHDPYVRFGRLPTERLYGEHSLENNNALGDEISIEDAGACKLRQWHQEVFNPTKARFFIVSNANTIEGVKPILDDICQSWPQRTALACIPAEETYLPHAGEQIFLVQGGAANQSTVLLSLLLPPEIKGLMRLSADAASYILQRLLNDRLREELCWTYGVSAMVRVPVTPQLPSMLQISCSVNAEHTAQTITEIKNVLDAYGQDKNIIAEYLDEYKEMVLSILQRTVTTTYSLMDAVFEENRRWDARPWKSRVESTRELESQTTIDLVAETLGQSYPLWTVIGSARGLSDSLNKLDIPLMIESGVVA